MEAREAKKKKKNVPRSFSQEKTLENKDLGVLSSGPGRLGLFGRSHLTSGSLKGAPEIGITALEMYRFMLCVL